MDKHHIKIKLKYELVDSTGCTDCKKFVVDTGVTYYAKFRLNSNFVDLGYFDVDTTYTGNTNITGHTTYMVTGECTSRLSELEKFTRSTDVSVKYVTTLNQDNDGLVLSATTTNTQYTYYIGGVRYVDNISADTTYFSFIREVSDVDYVNYPYYKDESKQNIIAKPKIINDINIERQAPTIMDSFYRIKDINILNDIEYYGGGSYFNVVVNA